MEAIQKPKYKTKIVKNVMIPMRDGIHLAADLIMPDAEGKFPALIEYWPYRKDDITFVDLRLYGSFKPEDVATLPLENAEALVKGKAPLR